ncbi:MAG: acetate--CoA ligase family protein, partial [Gammaproteobacteria bacterium]
MTVIEARRRAGGGSLDCLFEPTSVAVVGASDDPSRIGGRPLRYLIEAPFQGAVYPVNPNRDRAQGLSCYARVEDIGKPVDLAIVSVPARAVLESVAACAECAVKAVILFSAGFAEVGENGLAAQQALTEIADSTGLRILGPNCLGAYNAHIGFYGTFSTSLEFGFPQAGRVGVVSQSGAYGAYVALLARRQGVHVGYWVTTGNECDVHVAECIAWMAQAPDIDVIAVYAEGVRDGRALLDALELARANAKPVVFLKVGRSSIGAIAARSHTAALAGSDAVFDGIFAQTGVYRARDAGELLDAAYACSRGRRPVNDRVGIMTVSGGAGIQMADDAQIFGLDVAPMPAPTQAELKTLLPFASARNPVDVTAQFFNRLELLPAFLDSMLSSGNYGTVVAFYTYVAAVESMAAPIADAVRAAVEKYPDRLMVLCIVGPPAVLCNYEAAGCLVFEDPTRAMRAAGVLNHFARAFERNPELREAPPASPPPKLPADPLNECAAKQLMSRAGIPGVPERLTLDLQDAQRAAAEIGYPVVLKLCGASLTHKTEVGGVILGVDSPGSLARCYEDLLANAERQGLRANIDGILVARQMPGGV